MLSTKGSEALRIFSKGIDTDRFGQSFEFRSLLDLILDALLYSTLNDIIIIQQQQQH